MELVPNKKMANPISWVDDPMGSISQYLKNIATSMAIPVQEASQGLFQLTQDLSSMLYEEYEEYSKILTDKQTLLIQDYRESFATLGTEGRFNCLMNIKQNNSFPPISKERKDDQFRIAHHCANPYERAGGRSKGARRWFGGGKNSGRS